MGQSLLAAVAALAATVTPVPLPTVADPAASSPAETLDTARDRAMRMTVPTSVNGQGPYSFTIDTGADRSVVSDRLAERLQLPPGKHVIMHGIVGVQPVRTVQVDRLKIGSAERRGIATPVLPELSLGAVGFLGLDALADQSIVLDFKRNRIVMARSSDRDRERGDPETIVVTGKSRFGQLILTDARIGNRKVYAIIDTGAENSIGNPQLRRLLLGSPNLRENPLRLIGVTGESLPAEPGTIPRIRLGSLFVSNMPIAFADVHTFKKFGVGDVPAILVGMDVLRGFERVAVDFRHREVRFRIGDGDYARS